MKNYIQKYICKSVALFVGTSLMLTGCSESFLDPDPLNKCFLTGNCIFYGKWV